MLEQNNSLYQLNGDLIWNGFKLLLPISIFVAVFGVAFGVAATQTGLNTPSSLWMSALVFAGASQFAALELWAQKIPVVTLLLTVFAINARHLLMGATLYPWLCKLHPVKRYSIMLVVSDANWAMAMQAFGRGKPGLGILFGGGLAIWLFWLLGTWLGIYFGNAIQDPVSLGLDMVMGCFLLTMVVSGDINVRILIIWVVAASASLLAYRYLPQNSHVVVGALAGGIAGVLLQDNQNDH